MIGAVSGVRVVDIMRTVAEFYGIEKGDLARHRRQVRFVRPRQVAMYLAAKMTDRSQEMIGNFFERDHTTVIHAVKRIAFLMSVEPQLAQQVEECAARAARSAGAEHWRLAERIIDEVFEELRPVLLREAPAGRAAVLRHLGAIAANEEGRSA